MVKRSDRNSPIVWPLNVPAALDGVGQGELGEVLDDQRPLARSGCERILERLLVGVGEDTAGLTASSIWFARARLDDVREQAVLVLAGESVKLGVAPSPEVQNALLLQGSRPAEGIAGQPTKSTDRVRRNVRGRPNPCDGTS
jgi:hypothetical protein